MKGDWDTLPRLERLEAGISWLRSQHLGDEQGLFHRVTDSGDCSQRPKKV